MKKAVTFAISLLFLLAIQVPGIAAPAGTGKVYDLKIATVVADTSPLHLSMLKALEEIEKNAPGRFKIRIYPNSQMGGERDVANGLLLGTVHAAIISDGTISMVDTLRMAEVGNTPFLIKSIPAFYAMCEEFFGDMINKEYERRGFTNVAYYLAGGVDVGNTKKPIEKPQDFQGLKIRTYEAAGPMKFLKDIGAIPVAMAFGEVYTGMQQGTIDGVSTSDFQFVSQKFTDLCKHQTAYHVFYNYQSFTFSKAWMDSLPEDLQQVIKKAGKVSQDYCRDVVSVEFGKKTYAAIEAEGVKLVRLTPEQRQAFVDVLKPTYPEYRKMYGEEVFDRVQKFMDAWKE